MKRQIFCVGESFTAFRIISPDEPYLSNRGMYVRQSSGTALFAAAALHQLSIDCSLISVIGSDTLGKEAFADIEGTGVEAASLLVRDGCSNICIADRSGCPLCFYPSENCHIQPKDLNTAALQSGDIVLFDALWLQNAGADAAYHALAAAAADKGGLLVLSSLFADRPPTLEQCSKADILCLSASDAAALCPRGDSDALAALLQNRTQAVFVFRRDGIALIRAGADAFVPVSPAVTTAEQPF
jgi:sugar/nucleoside kinase (ribokinase family)